MSPRAGDKLDIRARGDAGYRAIAAEHGDPAGVLTDNGAVFIGRFRGGGQLTPGPRAFA